MSPPLALMGSSIGGFYARYLAAGLQVVERVVTELPWNPAPHRPFVAFDHVGSEAMFFSAYAWIEDRTQEPYYRGLLLDALVDALEDAGVSVGQTTNLAIRERGRHDRDDRPRQ